ncbi:hypothetical protein AUC69_12455 [Methyloceanibacter superfactus]|uniref:Glycosyl transferase family 28 C-terminal domain-containing protein n=1 Tax=Methyloceanibacter superfactus TaxID=1774969 RepID=A0A1E3VV68_9HYPH|nr:glycosyltransferase [Methyloceanibacter superfactus]ODR97415.1 hypothetical protein AUC69_12455 [Methyloceanibacter superfactus]
MFKALASLGLQSKRGNSGEGIGEAMMITWVMIPARGGSRGVPRKNVRLLAGFPLIVHTIRTALSVCDPKCVAVITDDDEIAAISCAEGVRVLREPPTTGRATLDEVALKVAHELEAAGADSEDIFLTLQPTCPFLSSARLVEALAAFEGGAGSVITVVDDRHLSWRPGADGEPIPAYEKRVNRQMLERRFRETGAIIGCRLKDLMEQGTRIVEPIRLIELPKEESLDIDDFADWAVAEHIASRRKVVIRADASETLGMGHVYRALALAQELARHEIVVATDISHPLGPKFLSQFPFEVRPVDGDDGFVELVQSLTPDLVILDQLDTTDVYVEAIKSATGSVVTFEDMGIGAEIADLVVSDLYENLSVPGHRQLTGMANAILAPSFETARQPAQFKNDVENVLVVFGGTDPSALTEKALEALAKLGFSGTVTVVLGPGVSRPISLGAYALKGEICSNVSYMPGIMQRADLAISSAGRTITELASLGIPVLCLCQNDKELTHTHASARFGVVNLGLGALVDTETIAAHMKRLMETPNLRQILRARALHESSARSNAAVMRRIKAKIGWKDD